jgi:hypothetical protein
MGAREREGCWLGKRLGVGLAVGHFGSLNQGWTIKAKGLPKDSQQSGNAMSILTAWYQTPKRNEL